MSDHTSTLIRIGAIIILGLIWRPLFASEPPATPHPVRRLLIIVGIVVSLFLLAALLADFLPGN